MTRTIPMRNGIFLAPFHPLDQDPTEAIHRDLELVQQNLDRLGYEEAWIGEHHSAGFEIISSPEGFHRRRGGANRAKGFASAPAWCRCPTTTR